MNISIIKDTQVQNESFKDLKDTPNTLGGYNINDGVYRNTSICNCVPLIGIGNTLQSTCTIEGDSSSGIISFFTSNGFLDNVEALRVEFTNPNNKKLYPTITANSENLVEAFNHFYVSDISLTSFTISLTKNQLQPQTLYKIIYNLL